MSIGLGLDLETTSLNIDNCKILEVGVARFCDKEIIDMNSWLVYQDESFLTEEVKKISKFKVDMVTEFGYKEDSVLKRLNKVIESVDYIVAYNGRSYDKLVYENTCKRLGIEPIDKLWVDPLKDIDFGPEIFGRKLVHVAAEHGFLNPFPHRALFDVVTMLKIYFSYDEQIILDNAKAPVAKIFAINLPFSRKDEAKNRGYKWDTDNKIWYLEVRDTNDLVSKECAECGFTTKVIYENN